MVVQWKFDKSFHHFMYRSKVQGSVEALMYMKTQQYRSFDTDRIICILQILHNEYWAAWVIFQHLINKITMYYSSFFFRLAGSLPTSQYTVFEQKLRLTKQRGPSCEIFTKEKVARLRLSHK